MVVPIVLYPSFSIRLIRINVESNGNLLNRPKRNADGLYPVLWANDFRPMTLSLIYRKGILAA
jgi:hypothetical protein